MSIVIQFAETSRLYLAASAAAAITLLLISPGCGPGPAEITKIGVTCPGRTSVECDESVAHPLIQSIAGLPRLIDCIAMSQRGSVEIYVTWDGPQNSQALTDRLARAANLLPPNVDQPTIAVLAVGSSIPVPETGDEQVVAIRVDRKKLQTMGISASAVARQVSSLAGPVAGATRPSLAEIESTPVSSGQQ